MYQFPKYVYLQRLLFLLGNIYYNLRNHLTFKHSCSYTFHTNHCSKHSLDIFSKVCRMCVFFFDYSSLRSFPAPLHLRNNINAYRRSDLVAKCIQFTLQKKLLPGAFASSLCHLPSCGIFWD